MIFTKRGTEIKIEENFGSQEVGERKHILMLLKVRVVIEIPCPPFYAFAEFLKATDGWKEISEAATRAPRGVLMGEELQKAIIQAE